MVDYLALNSLVDALIFTELLYEFLLETHCIKKERRGSARKKEARETAAAYGPRKTCILYLIVDSFIHGWLVGLGPHLRERCCGFGNFRHGSKGTKHPSLT
jgi:hypothetical protein